MFIYGLVLFVGLFMEANIIQVPYSLDAEQAVIGAVLRDPESIHVVVESLSGSDDFYNKRHRLIFEAMTSLHSELKPCDISSVAVKLNDKDLLNEIGGRTYLAELQGFVGSSAHLKSHCDIVKEKSIARKVIYACEETVKSLTANEIGSDGSIQFLESNLLNLQSENRKADVITLKEMADEYFNEVENREEPNKEDLIETQLPDLNRLLEGGFWKGNVAVIAGQPSMGKTAFTLGFIIYNILEKMKSGLFVSLDQTNRDVLFRVLTNKTKIPRKKLRFHNSLIEREREMIMESTKSRLNNSDKFFMTDKGDLSPEQIRSLATQYHIKHGLDIVCIDYLQLVNVPNKRDRFVEIGRASQVFKAMAKELNILVVLVSQLNREYSSIQPKEENCYAMGTMSMLKDSSQIEQDANYIIFPHRPLEALKKRNMMTSDLYLSLRQRYDSPNEIAYVGLAKSKDTPTGNVKCLFNAVNNNYFGIEENRVEFNRNVIERDEEIPF